nr:MAG TPA: hypothetical protein [Caudoviricetes sp.]
MLIVLSSLICGGRSAAGGSEYLSHREFLSSFSVPALTVSRWLSTFARSLVPCYGLIISR